VVDERKNERKKVSDPILPLVDIDDQNGGIDEDHFYRRVDTNHINHAHS